VEVDGRQSDGSPSKSIESTDLGYSQAKNWSQYLYLYTANTDSKLSYNFTTNITTEETVSTSS